MDDLDSALFESQYIIPEGISYNSYLIKDSRTAILDTVDACQADAWKENLAEALDGVTPDYLVVHHMEPDHSALIAWALEQWPSLTVVASSKALQMLSQFFEGISLEGYTGRKVAMIENGSWAPSAARVMREQLSAMKGVDLVEPQVTIISRMKSTDIPALESLADSILATH